MGKNAGFKAAQAARHRSSAADNDAEGPPGAASTAPHPDGIDVTFHTPQWHAARLAALTAERMTWDDYKAKRAEDAAKEAELAGEDKLREYRAQLDADRAARLAGRGPAAGSGLEGVDKRKKRKHKSKDKHHKSKSSKKHNKDKDKDKDHKHSKKHHKKSKKRRHSDSSSDSDSSSSSSSSSSDSGQSGGGQPAKKAKGPIKLSEYLKS